MVFRSSAHRDLQMRILADSKNCYESALNWEFYVKFLLHFVVLEFNELAHVCDAKLLQVFVHL